MNNIAIAQDKSCPVYNLDLSHDPLASFEYINLNVDDPCCGAPNNYNCFTINVTLHPDAMGVDLTWTTAGGNTYYYINCEEMIDAGPHIRALKICTDDSEISFTFCRTGNPTYDLTITSFDELDDEDVSIPEIDDICIDHGHFFLNDVAPGSPPGGTYYINGEEAMCFFDLPNCFDPMEHGVGTHDITYVYEFENTEGCYGSDTQTITVHDLPDVELEDIEACMYDDYIYLYGGTPFGGTYFGEHVDNGTFDFTSSGPGTFQIYYEYTDANGCYGIDSAFIHVYELPIADAGPDQTIPSGTTANLDAAAGGTGTYNYSWSPPVLVTNPNNQNTTTLPLTVSTVFTLTVTDIETGCVNTDQVIIYVTGGDLNIVGLDAHPSTICVGDSVQLFVLVTGGSGNYSYSWTSDPPGFTSNIHNPVVAPEVTTIYYLTVEDLDTGETVSGDAIVTVHPLPVVSLDPFDPVCGGDTIVYMNGGEPWGGIYSIPTIGLYDINSINPQVIGSGSFIIVYEYRDVNFCSNTATRELTIYPRVKANFHPQRSFCENNEVTFLNLSENGTFFIWQIDGYEFFYDDYSSVFYPYDPQPEEIIVSAFLNASDDYGCYDTISKTFRISPYISASFTPTVEQIDCSPYDVFFQNTSEGPIGFHYWSFGDGYFSIENNPTHTYNNFNENDITYYASLTTVSENFMCTEVDSLEITAHPYIKADFGFTPSQVCAPFEVTIENTATGAHNYEYFVNNELISTSDEAFVYHTFDNFTNEPIDYLITQKVSNPMDCEDEHSEFITVYPFLEAGFDASVIEGCAPLSVSFTNIAEGTIDHYFYEYGDGGSSTISSPSHTFENKTDETITYTVMQVVSSDYFCADTTYLDIIVHPEIYAEFSFIPEVICNMDTITFTGNITTNSGYSFYWDFGDGPQDHDLVETSYVFEHNDPNPVSQNISLYAENDQGCISIPSQDILVYPKVNADFNATPIIGCSPLDISFINQSEGAENYLWDFGDDGSSGEENPVHVYTSDDYENIKSFTVKLMAISQYFCKDSVEMEIDVYPAISAEFFVENAAGCSPFEISISNQAQGVSIFEWDFGDGSPLSNADDTVIMHTYINDGNEPVQYNLSLYVENDDECYSEKIKPITVYPEVTSYFEYDSEGCSPHNPNFVNLSVNAHDYFWQMGDGIISMQENPTHNYYNHSYTDTKEFTVSLLAESVYKCAHIFTGQVEVLPTPDVNFYIDNPEGCSPHEAIFINQSIGIFDEFLWDFGDGNTGSQSSSDFTHTYKISTEDNAEIFEVILEGINNYGCPNNHNQQVVVYPDIEASFTTNTLIGCHPLTVEFNNESSGATAHSAYLWDYGDGHTSTNSQLSHTHTFNNYSQTDPVIYNVMLVASNSNTCSDTSYVEITVNPRPLANFTSPNSTGCSPHNVQFNDLAIGENLTYFWDMGDGKYYELGGSFTHEYNQPADAGVGVFTVVLEVTNDYNCSHEYQQNITVYPDIMAEFDFVENGCHPLVVNFDNLSEGAYYHYWEFGDGNSSQVINPTYTFNNFDFENSESFLINLTVASEYGCTDSYSQSISVNPKPLAAFDISETAGCSPFNPLLSDYSIGVNDYLWTMGNGDSLYHSSNFSYTWANTSLDVQHNLVQLFVTNNYACTDSTSINVSVYPEVEVDFDTDDGVYEGCSKYQVQFISSSALGVYMLWDFGDGNTSTSINPLHVFSNTGEFPVVYNVNLTATSVYGCNNYSDMDITVLPSPVADFRPTPQIQAFPESDVFFENLTSPGEYQYYWDFGDENFLETNSRNPFFHTYERDENDFSTITYTVRLDAFNDFCVHSKTKYVTITSPQPVAIFSPSTQGCSPFTVEFQNHSLYSTDYQWYFGDGAMSISENPVHTFFYSEVYDVMLIASGDGGTDITYQTITVFETPTALFEISSPYIKIPDDPLITINKSLEADFYYWDFGDNNFSAEFEPVHYYSEPGLYSITLTASTDTEPQCFDTYVLENALRVDELCRVYFPNAFTPSPTGSSGGSYDPVNITNEVFFPIYEGLKDYELSIFNKWGELIFISKDPMIGWDGYHRGRIVPQDAYVWKLVGLCTNGTKLNKTGTVTVLR